MAAITTEHRHAAGSLFILGFDGTGVAEPLDAWIERWRPAGFILFRRNIESPAQVARLCAALRARYPADDPPLISVDQEGGRVARLRAPFTELPSARVLGRHYARTGSLDLIARAGAVTAAELTAVGINLNYAPVLDVDSNPANPVIGDRALAADPETVATVGNALIAAYQAGGLIACGKHFPGHGDTSSDSHYDLPVVKRDREALERVELLPFRRAVSAGVAAVMTAHVLYPELDPTWPATLSRPILTGLLRESMGFDGLIITDNMEMRGVWGRWDADTLVHQSITAGCDLFIGGGGGLQGQQPQTDIQLQLMEALAARLAAGRLSKDRLTESQRRIQAAKARLPRWTRLPTESQLQRIGQDRHQAVADALRHGDQSEGRAT
jgi:beta-N-acetylhexosaminidase